MQAVHQLQHRVEVWVTHDGTRNAEHWQQHGACLSAEEQARAERLVRADDRARFVIGRALTRTLLSHVGGRPPALWNIVVDERGRPLLGDEHAGVGLRFNLSHTDGLVACAVTLAREIGVDVENTTRPLTHETLPERFFSPAEVADLRALPTVQQAATFFQYWTLKESYLKARGLGLALPLGLFTFRDVGATPRIEFDPRLPDDPASWQFAQFSPTPAHRLAVAVRRGTQDLAIRVRQIPAGGPTPAH